jgi:hypothetical protein
MIKFIFFFMTFTDDFDSICQGTGLNIYLFTSCDCNMTDRDKIPHEMCVLVLTDGQAGNSPIDKRNSQHLSGLGEQAGVLY